MYTENYDELFRNYLDICNRALAEHRDEPRFRQAVKDAEKLPAGGRTAVALHEDLDSAPVETFTIGFNEGEVRLVSHAAEEPDYEDEPAFLWRVSTEDLREVVANPEPYIEDPLQLDWDWVFARLLLRAQA